MIGFKSAAIQYKKNGHIVERYGTRHHEIIKTIADLGDTEYYKAWHQDGFIYGDEWVNQFLTRAEATEKAEEMGIEMRGSELTTEDLW